MLRLERGAPLLQLLPLEAGVVAPRVGQECVDLPERRGLGAGREGGVGRVAGHVLFSDEVERDGTELGIRGEEGEGAKGWSNDEVRHAVRAETCSHACTTLSLDGPQAHSTRPTRYVRPAYLGSGDLLDVARVTSPDESGDGGSRGDLPTALEEEGMHGALEGRPEEDGTHRSEGDA